MFTAKTMRKSKKRNYDQNSIRILASIVSSLFLPVFIHFCTGFHRVVLYVEYAFHLTKGKFTPPPHQPGDVWQREETFLIVKTKQAGVPLTHWWKPEVLLSILQCTRQTPPPAENYLIQTATLRLRNQLLTNKREKPTVEKPTTNFTSYTVFNITTRLN